MLADGSLVIGFVSSHAALFSGMVSFSFPLFSRSIVSCHFFPSGPFCFNSVLRISDSELRATVKDGKARKGQLDGSRSATFIPLSTSRQHGTDLGWTTLWILQGVGRGGRAGYSLNGLRLVENASPLFVAFAQSSTEHRQKTLRRPPKGQ